MKILFDTNVLIASIVEQHDFHARALPWMAKALSGEIIYHISQHSLAEMYSVLTSLPVRPKISPVTANRLIVENTKRAKVVTLGPADYRWCIQQMSSEHQIGGAIYDALIARAALKSHVDRLLTFDPDDFRRVLPPDRLNLILVPG